jgi:2-desacetyl-2-hydroxyethyl bacteriochlorophyllide A dehydrogenase
VKIRVSSVANLTDYYFNGDENMNNLTVVFPEPKRVVIEDRQMPNIGDDDMLVQTIRTVISIGTELTILNGEFPRDSAWDDYGKFPFIPGYNNVGKVVDVGKNVDKSWVGRKVAGYMPHSAYTIVRPESIRVINRDIPDEEAVFFTLAEIVMNGVRRGEVSWGESVVVYGLGLIGQFASRFCHFAGARPVIGIDVSENRIGILPKIKGIKAVNTKNTDAVKAVSELTNGRMADIVFEVTGNPDIIPQEFPLLKRQGKIVILSSPRGITKNFDFHDLCNSPSYTIIGAHNGSHPQFETPYNQWTQKRHAELYFNMVADGEIDVKPLISHRAKCNDAPNLYQMLMDDRTQAMGVVMEW